MTDQYQILIDTVVALREQISILTSRVEALEIHCNRGQPLAGSRPTEAEIIELMEDYGCTWEDAQEQLMRGRKESRDEDSSSV